MPPDHHATLTGEARTWLDATGRDQLVLPCTRAHRGVALAGQLATRLDPSRSSQAHAELRDLWDRISVSVGSQDPGRWDLVTETAHHLRHLIRGVGQQADEEEAEQQEDSVLLQAAEQEYREVSR